jgi:hypothetical protein
MQHPPMIAATRAAQDAGETARDAATNPWIVRLARGGYATKGVVYLLIGILAARAALGVGGETTDNRGAIEALYRQPFGRALVGLVALGLFAYALWLFVAAALDPERKGADAKGAATRIISAMLGCTYAALGAVAARLVVQQRSSGKSSDATTHDGTATLLAHPFGAALVVLIGLIVLGMAGYFFFQAATARFRDTLDLGGATATERGWVGPLGRAGFAALGVVDVIIGFFLIIAAVRHNAGETKGVGSALAAVGQQPFGRWLLGVVALGFIAYAAYTFAEARYRRLVAR